MKFVILKPQTTYDPRGDVFQSLADLHIKAAPLLECETEDEAVREVRRMVTDAVPIMFPIEIGPAKTHLLGVVEDPSIRINIDAQIPFVMFVQAMSTCDADRMALRRGPAFTRSKWKLPPLKPQIAHQVDIELRSTDLEVPVYTTAEIGADHLGRSTLYVEVGGIEVSISLRDAVLQVR